MATENDPTKTRWFVAIDLMIKSISAIGVIVLGIAGWSLQSGTQRQQDAIRAREMNAQIYLPPLQALAELQIAFSLNAAKVDGAIGEIDSASYGWQLTYLLDSLHFPSAFDKDKISMTPLASYDDRHKPHGGLTTPYKKAAALAAELDASLPILRDLCHKSADGHLKYVSLKSSPPALYFAQSANTSLPGDEFVPIETANYDEWKLWFPADEMFVSTFCQTNLRPIYQELAKASSDISALIIAGNPELAEKALAVRVDAMKSRKDVIEDGEPH
jgi:hypothetical protein